MTSTTIALRRGMAATAAALLLGTLAACGGADDDSALPTAGDGTASSDTGAADDTEDLDREDAMLEFARCMREHGVDMPDPEPGEGPRILADGGADPAQVEAAHEACQEYLEQAMPEDGRMRDIPEEDKQAMLDMAACMRERGHDFPDPLFEGGRVTQRMEEPGEGGVDPDDPAFRTDLEECANESGLEPPDGGPDEQES